MVYCYYGILHGDERVPPHSHIHKIEGWELVIAERRQITLFKDRRDAGKQLAQELLAYAGRSDVIVLALPRGGVPVAYEVARALNAPLDIFIVRKLGLPGHEELALGAIASGGIRDLIMISFRR